MTSKYDVKVPPEGNPDAQIMIVGESPGEHEYRQGRPFVGPTGKQLDLWFRQVGLDREDLWLTNVSKYMPKGDKKKWFFDSHGQPRERYAEGIAELKAEIESVQPRVVVAMGNYAFWPLYGEMNITKWRGSLLECRLVPGPVLVPTIHPSYVLRVWTDYPLLVWDLQRAAEEARNPIGPPTDRTYNYIRNPTQHQIDEAVTAALRADLITIDTEWFSPDDLSCIGFTTNPDWAICIPSSHPGAIPAYQAVLSSHSRKVFQNAMFDCSYLEWAGLPVKVEHDGRRLVEDTMVGHYVTWPQLRKGLDLIASVYTREPYYKDERKIAVESDYANLDQYWLYNCKDVRVTHEAWMAIEDDMKHYRTREAYELNMSLFIPLLRSTILGIRCDHKTLANEAIKYKKEAAKYDALLKQITGRDFNPRSPKQVKELVYETLGVRKTSKMSVDQETLMNVAAQTSDKVTKAMLTIIIRGRESKNVTSKYINHRLPDDDGRIRSSWNMAGTKNGRYSASKNSFKGTGASLQTFPAQARRVCAADPGYILVKPDQAQAEARIVACYADDYRTLGWLEDGLDIHSKMAETIYGIPYEEIRQGYEEGDEKMSRIRYISKTCKHGTNYRMGKFLLMKQVNKNFHETKIGITSGEADRIRQTILSNHPLEVWWKKVEAELGRGRFLVNPLGRKRIFTDRWGSSLFGDAVAFLPQSTAADLNKIGLVKVWEWMREKWPGDKNVGILAEMHDGSLLQLPETVTKDDLEEIRELLTIPIVINHHPLEIPIEISAGPNWEDMKGV